MEIISLTQNWQYVAWFLALINVVVALYVVVLNPRHTSNRHTMMLMLLFAAQITASGIMMGATNAENATVPAAFIAASSLIALPAALLTVLIVFRPNWLASWQGFFIRSLYFLIYLPILITAIDLWQGSNLWFVDLPATYQGGLLSTASYTQGTLAATLRVVNIYIPALLIIVFLVYIGAFARGEPRPKRTLAFLLIGAHLAALTLMITSLGIENWEPPLLFMHTAYLVILGYASFQNLISPRSEQTGSLQVRLTALILAVSVPVLIAVTLLVTLQARSVLLQEAQNNLRSRNSALRTSINFWLDFNVRALQELASRPEIYRMNPEDQKPALERFARTYPHMYLVSVTDLEGMNTARNDTADLTDYSDRTWFKSASGGEAVTYQTLIGRTSGQPALVVSVPVRNSEGGVVGVAMFASDLDAIVGQLQSMRGGERGEAFVLDQNNMVVAHPDQLFSGELKDLSSHPVVKKARAGQLGGMEFSDAKDDDWQAYVSELSHSWLIVVQYPTAQLLTPVNTFQNTAFTGVGLGILLLFLLAGLTVSQGIEPIRRLTKTALIISEGDLTNEAEIESRDEVGFLAEAFNRMTQQLRSFIVDLEKRVNDRTKDLEKRALQLQVTAEVAREALAITDLETLLTHSARLISRRFSFYHTGIFLIDEAREYAHLRAASSEGGQLMLARKHRLKVGQEGIVGNAAATGNSRIALDVGADAVFFNNPDLPNTRSEVALPLKVRDTVIGVLDVQSKESWPFSQEDMDILQILADQIALGIENARLLASSQQALRDLEALYSTQTRQAWENRLEDQVIAYHYSPAGVVQTEPVQIASQVDDPYSLIVPISLRDQELGRLMLRRDTASGVWLAEEKMLLEQTISQVALALENARLLDEVQRNAYEEQVIGEIAATAQSSLNLDTVMKSTIEELGRVLKVARIQIRLSNPADDLLPVDGLTPLLSGKGNGAGSDNGQHSEPQAE